MCVPAGRPLPKASSGAGRWAGALVSLPPPSTPFPALKSPPQSGEGATARRGPGVAGGRAQAVRAEQGRGGPHSAVP